MKRKIPLIAGLSAMLFAAALMAAAFLGHDVVSAAGDPPAAPSSLSAERHDGNIEIIFTHPSSAEVDGWQVQVRAGGTPWGDWYDLPDTSPDSINGFIDGTDNDVRYRIRLRAVNEHGAGPYLKTVSAASNRASAPADMEAVADGASVIYLTWRSPDDDAITGYQYKFRPKGGTWGDWTDATSTVSSESEYITFDDLEADTVYQFKLRAMRDQVAGYVGRAKGSTAAAAEDAS